MIVYLVECGANIDRCARLCDAFRVPISYVSCSSNPGAATQRRMTVPWTAEDECPTGAEVLALTPHASAMPISLVAWDRVDSILVGNEKSGLPQDVIDGCTAARIPIYGEWHSLTIEQSLSIALWDWHRWMASAEHAGVTLT
ncbi:MAG: TrmH family RNA methyltransferase [Armatimonadia bacterium]